MFFPTIYPFTSSQIALVRGAIALGIGLSFLVNFHYLSLPIVLACLLLFFGYFQKITSSLIIVMTVIQSTIQHSLPSIWLILTLAFLIVAPKGNFFKIHQNASSSRSMHTLIHSMYSVFICLLGLFHLYEAFYGTNPLTKLILSEDPWSRALPFFAYIPVAIVEIAAGALSLRKGLSKGLWTASLILTVCSLIFSPSLASASFLIYHILLFRLPFVPSIGSGGLVIYDGACGLCHGFVLLLLKEDFRHNLYYLSNEDEKLKKWRDAYASLPFENSVIFVEKGSPPLIKSEAVVSILQYIGGFWGLIGYMITLLPKGLCDFIYSLIAKLRHHLASTPEDSCPIIPEDLKQQFSLPEDLL